ncbi:predicted sensory transduction histidine kinase [Methanothermobacter marburgensis str. Marburg]|uniref:Predicted sensory transduction histidine kinase n=1 Tax=Methanothermobacter marburgensis (strain ATCC BAA-927 / DSM 2133 / JCM 14651 / NBRC 100331 / OCM 82 / Marburg) TaxID=79929 RepID=D9PX62_METTM|nr:predicted sensory transduction histidine kinase [Methanothermobacter marburgensis str. Marburg]
MVLHRYTRFIDRVGALVNRTLTFTEKIQSYRDMRTRLAIVALLTALCVALTVYFHMFLGVEIVFTHIFYIPIVLAALWFERKSFLVTALLGTVLIVTNTMASLSGFYEDLLRVSVMLFVNLITVFLAESIEESEEVIRETEEKYRTIVETARDAIITADERGRVVSWNHGAEKIFGYTADEMKGKHINKIISEQNRDMHNFQDINSDVSLMITDVEAVRKDGKGVPVDISVTGWHYMGENFVTAVIRDISERKKAEEALRESEKKFRAVFNGVEDIITIVELRDDGLPGNYIEVNRTAVEKLGYSRDELLNMTPMDLGPTKEEISDNMRKLLERKAARFERTYISKDGRRIPVEVNSRLIEIGGKNVVVSVSRDITHRLENERKLRESEEKYRSLFDLSPDYIILLDLEGGVILDINSTLSERLGMAPEELRGTSIYDVEFIADDVKHKFRSKLEIIKDEGNIEPYEVVLNDPLGRKYTVRIYNKLVHAEGRDCALVVLHDISDLKRTQRMLEKSLEEKELLLKEIHHRVKNNLMIISSLLSLQSRKAKDEETLDLFRESENRARSMALIHERLYRSEDLKNIDMGEYVRTLASEVFRSYSADSRIRLNMDVDELKVDVETAIPVGLIVNELLTNAVKHAFPHGEGTVSVSVKRSNNHVLIEVSDDGVGFPQDLDWESSPSLGLQLVRNLTDQIDGTAEMISEGGYNIQDNLHREGRY